MTIHVLDQLPLWVEGDLSTADLTVVEGHLTECPTCQAAAERLRTSQAWLREALAPPFDASDEGALHRAVMAQLRVETTAKPTRRLALRRGLLVACAASLLIATLIWRRERSAVASAPGIPAPMAALRPGAEPTQEASPRLAHHDPARTLPPPTRPRTVVAPADSPPEEPARIEFQTADPNIRIIWLARATPLPDTNPSLQEEP
jgi:anti-sigma factor RsiW